MSFYLFFNVSNGLGIVHERLKNEKLNVSFDVEEELMLASGSQDTFVRLWKITSKNATNDESDNTVTLETQSFQAYSKGSASFVIHFIYIN